jgi:hypothetical protein
MRERLLSTEEAAAVVNRTRQLVGWWVRKGYLRPVRVDSRGKGHGHKFREADVLAAANRKPNKPGPKVPDEFL